ncbi:MAG: choice-of-anchor D domain-containing protein, partial [Acidobacteriota bacterium]|nr:choice-of-anchor D domain-containing protein [Acidobacteriota bacterium]
MNRLRSKSTWLVCTVVVVVSLLLSWQATRADWIHRLFNADSFSLLFKQSKKLDAAGAPAVNQRTRVAEAGSRVMDVKAGDGTLTSEPVASVLADLNEDGKLDLVAAHANHLVTVWYGRPSGAFDPPVAFSIEAQARALAVADVTGDGHLDVVLTDLKKRSLLVLVGDGKGGLPQAERVALSGAPTQIVIKDFVGGQRPDVLVSMSRNGQTKLVLWTDIGAAHGAATRTLATEPIILNTSLAENLVKLEVGYVNADQYADILAVHEDRLAVLYGDASAPYSRVSTSALTQPVMDCVFGDFNGDANVDLAVLGQRSQEVLIYSAQPDGQWGVRERLVVGPTATALAVADRNDDRVDDLVVLRAQAEEIAVYLGNRRGSLGGEDVVPVNGQPVRVEAGYLDGDERVDLAVLKQQGVSLLQSADEAAQADNPITAVDPPVLDVQVPEGECRTVPVTITIAPTVFRPLDVYLLMDATAGNDFRAEAEQLVRDFFELRNDIRVGIGTFRDYPVAPFGEPGDFVYNRVMDLTTVNVASRNRLINAIKSIQAAGGGDEADAQLSALFQTATGEGEAGYVEPDLQASFRRDIEVEKIVVLITGSNFHTPSDAGYPGRVDFAAAARELNARGIKVIGVATGGPNGDASNVVRSLRRIAELTGTFAYRDVDFNGDGQIDIRRGQPNVCPPAQHVRLRDIVLAQVRGFDLTVPLTLEIDRDCTPITFMIDPPVQFVNPRTGGSFTFNVTFCVPCGAAPCECAFETKVILDEIIRTRIPSRVQCTRPACEISPLNFGDVCVGDAGATRPLVVRNTGTGDFTITAANSSNPAFTVVTPLPVTVPAGGTANLDVRVVCAGPGLQTGSISFVTDPPSTCNSTAPLCAPVDVSAFCVQITGDVEPRSLDFGDVCVGDSASRTVTIRNTGNRPLTVTGISSSNPSFEIVNPGVPITIDPGASAVVTIELKCSTPGAQSGVISFTTDSACGPVDLGTVNVAGFCVQVAGAVDPRAIDFGDVCVGQTSERTFTISNTGNRPFTVTAISSDNAAFTVVSPATPVTIAAGGSATVTV